MTQPSPDMNLGAEPVLLNQFQRLLRYADKPVVLVGSPRHRNAFIASLSTDAELQVFHASTLAEFAQALNSYLGREGSDLAPLQVPRNRPLRLILSNALMLSASEIKSLLGWWRSLGLSESVSSLVLVGDEGQWERLRPKLPSAWITEFILPSESGKRHWSAAANTTDALSKPRLFSAKTSPLLRSYGGMAVALLLSTAALGWLFISDSPLRSTTTGQSEAAEQAAMEAFETVALPWHRTGPAADQITLDQDNEELAGVSQSAPTPSEKRLDRGVTEAPLAAQQENPPASATQRLELDSDQQFQQVTLELPPSKSAPSQLPSVDAAYSTDSAVEDFGPSLPSTAVTEESHVAMTASGASPGLTDDERFLLQQPGTGFTWQLFGVSDASVAEQQKQQLSDSFTVRIYRKSQQGEVMYLLTTGIYPSKEEAQLARSRWPSKMRSISPWLKPLEKVQQDIDSRREI